jgi:hypothetical protein
VAFGKKKKPKNDINDLKKAIDERNAKRKADEVARKREEKAQRRRNQGKS